MRRCGCVCLNPRTAWMVPSDPAWKTVACSSLWHFAGHKCLQSVSMIPCKCCKPATYKSARSVKFSVICVSALIYTDVSHFQSGLESFTKVIHWFFNGSSMFPIVSLPLYKYLHPLPHAAPQDNTDVWARYPQWNTGAGTWWDLGKV